MCQQQTITIDDIVSRQIETDRDVLMLAWNLFASVTEEGRWKAIGNGVEFFFRRISLPVI